MDRVGVKFFLFVFLWTNATLIAKNCAETLQFALPTFGFEVEYVPNENVNLWNHYRPANIPEPKWLFLPSDIRNRWVECHRATLAPRFREPTALVKISTAPSFFPEALIVDETGNWEMIGPVSTSLEELKQQLRTVESLIGPGSYQAHVVRPIDTLERGAAGYTLFSADLLTFRKFHSQLERYRSDSKQLPGAFFLHPYLSVFTRLKKEMLLAVMEANLVGQSWQTVIPQFQKRYPALGDVWNENRPFYKYTLANTYRTDIYGNTVDRLIRWGYEVRSAHKSLESLLSEIKTIHRLMEEGLSRFERFLFLEVVETEFPPNFSDALKNFLSDVIAQVEPEAPRPFYFSFLTRPFEQYAPLLGLPREEARALRKSILQARTRALEALEQLALERVDEKEAKARALLILAQFCENTGLLPKLERFLEQAPLGQFRKAA